MVKKRKINIVFADKIFISFSKIVGIDFAVFDRDNWKDISKHQGNDFS